MIPDALLAFGLTGSDLGYFLSILVAIWLGMTIEAYLEERRYCRQRRAWWRGERVG